VRPRVRASLLWGLVGLLSFLVLVQGYQLVGGRLPLSLAAGAAVVVALATVGATYVADR